MAIGGEIATAFIRIRPILDRGAVVGESKAMVKQVQETVAAGARANVSSTRKEIQANTELAGSFKRAAESAKVGSAETVSAEHRAATAARQAGHAQATAMKHSAGAAHHLRHSLLAVGGVFGIAFGVERLLEFGKSIAEHGIAAQKAEEAVKFSFGRSGEEIEKFAKGSASSLGISTHLAETTAGRFGILFKNMGIGRPAAAQMTVGFEQLAGSLAMIRGVAPEQFLKNLPLAAAGNTRSLKQMGIAVDSTSLKLAYMKVSGEKVTGSLTPAQKAIAVYAVATAKLGDYLKEAGKRSHDAANVQARLSAEWDNAKDRLGTALLPAVTKISTAMANWLHRMNQSGKLQQHINSVMHTAKEILNAVKSVWLALAPPITKVVHALGGAGNATKILIGLWAAWKVGGILSSLGKVVGRLLDIRGGAIKARVAMMALSTGGVLVGLAAIAIVAKKVADNIKGLQEQQIAAEEHTAAKGSGVRRALIPSLAKDINEMKARGVSGADIITNLRMRLSGRTEGSDAANALIADAFAFSSKLNRNRQTLVDEFAASAKKSAKSTADDVKKAADVVKNAAKGAAGAGAKGAAAGMDADTKAAVQKAKEGITELKTRMKDANQSARDQIVQTKQSLRDLQSNLADAVTQMKDDVASSVQEAQSNLISIGGTLGDSIGQILDKPFQIAGDRISRAQNKLALRFDLANAKLDAQARKLTAQQSKLGLENDQEALRALRRQVVLPGGRHLSEDPTKAIAQLEALEKKMQPGQRAGIEAFIRQYRGAVLTVAQDKLGIKQQTAGNKRAVAEGRLNLQTERLKVRQDAATVMKETAQRQIADMTAALASGKIKLTTFTKNIAHLMGREGISYKRAGHLLGSAFESGFRSQVKGLIDQATAIGEARRGGIQVTGTGMEPKIVRPLNVLHADQKKIEHIHQQIGHQQITLQRRIAHASEQQAKFSAQIRDRQTALSKRIAKAAEKTQAAAEKMASVAVNPAAASLLQNPGTQSDRSAALTGTTG